MKYVRQTPLLSGWATTRRGPVEFRTWNPDGKWGTSRKLTEIRIRSGRRIVWAFSLALVLEHLPTFDELLMNFREELGRTCMPIEARLAIYGDEYGEGR